MFVSKKFSRVFHSLDDAVTYAFFNDLIRVIEYRDDFSVPNDGSRRAHRIGVRLGEEISWGPWKDLYNGVDSIRPVYRVDLSSKLDNAYQGIV